MIQLSKEECEAVHEMIAMLSGHNPEYTFVWDGTDDPEDPGTAAFAKIFHAAGQSIPDNLRSVVE